MQERGLTLLELILALAMVGVVILSTSVLYLSSMRTAISANTESGLQRELDYVFRDMELHLRSAVGNGGALGPPSDPNYPDSPMLSRDFNVLWLGARNGNDPPQEIWYGYYTDGSRKLERWICPHRPDDWKQCEIKTISTGVLYPYARGGADLNGDGIVASEEQTKFNNCMGTLTKASCEDSGVFPVFEISGEKKVIWISLRAGTKVFGRPQDSFTGKYLITPGMTKAVYLHHQEE
jgi:prepilin-type N-terminal cleavage/methylation domain-containing protein